MKILGEFYISIRDCNVTSSEMDNLRKWLDTLSWLTVDELDSRCPWTSVREFMIESWDDRYSDYDGNTPFDDCVAWLKYIITKMLEINKGFKLIGSVVWCNFDHDTDPQIIIRKIVITNNVVETFSPNWVSDTPKTTKSACKR